MRDEDGRSGSLLGDVDVEARVGRDHPPRTIRRVVNDALAALSGEFSARRSGLERPSTPPETPRRESCPAAPGRFRRSPASRGSSPSLRGRRSPSLEPSAGFVLSVGDSAIFISELRRLPPPSQPEIASMQTPTGSAKGP